jgi:DNA polymerase elongation subunit (family B)
MPRRPPLRADQIGNASGILEFMHTRHKILYKDAAHNLNRRAVLCLLGSTRAVDSTSSTSANGSHSVALCIDKEVHPYFYVVLPPNTPGIGPQNAAEFAESLDYCVQKRLEAFANKKLYTDTPKMRTRRERVAEELRIELGLARAQRRCAWIESCTYDEMLPIKGYSRTKKRVYRVSVRNVWVHRLLTKRLESGHCARFLVDDDAAKECVTQACARISPTPTNEERTELLRGERQRRFKATLRIYELAECNLNIDVQLTCDMQLFCNTWVSVELARCTNIIANDVEDPRRWTNRQLELHCHKPDAFVVHEPIGEFESFAPFRILSWDGEMRSHKRGIFPQAALDPIIHMGFATRESVITPALPEKPYTYTVVGCVGACKKLDESLDIEVVQCSSELDLLIFTVYMLSCSANAYDADMSTGWNMDAFDMPYLEERLRVLFGPPSCRASAIHRRSLRYFTKKGVLPRLSKDQSYADIAHDSLVRFFPHWDALRARHPHASVYKLLMRQMSCFVRGVYKDHHGKLTNANEARLTSRKFSSGAHGKTVWQTMTMPGVQIADGLRRIRKTRTDMKSHGLKYAAKFLLKETIVEFDYELIPSTHQQSLDNPKNATGNQKLVRYAASDARAVPRIDANQADTLGLMEMGRITGLSNEDQTMRGEGIQSTMLLKMTANSTHMLLPRQPLETPPGSFPGGFVCTPVRGFYLECVIVLDFASLYPSIIVTYNVCYSTLVDTRGMSDAQRTAHFIELGITLNDVWLTPKEYVYFVKRSVREGILPMICRLLLQSRKLTKVQMKKLKAKLEQFCSEGADFHNMSKAQFDAATANIVGRIAVLNERQLSKKLRGNSIYGFIGAAFSLIPNKLISEIITTWGMHLDLQSAIVVFDSAEAGSDAVPMSKLRARSEWLDDYFQERQSHGYAGQSRLTQTEESQVRTTLKPEVNTPFQTRSGGVCCDYETVQKRVMQRARKHFAKELHERQVTADEMIAEVNNPFMAGPTLTGVARVVPAACGHKKTVQRRNLDQSRKQKFSLGTQKLTNMWRKTHVTTSTLTSTSTSTATATTTTTAASTAAAAAAAADATTPMQVVMVPTFSTRKRAEPLSDAERVRFYAWCRLYCWTKEERMQRPISYTEIHSICPDNKAGHASADTFLARFRPGGQEASTYFKREDLDVLEPFYAWEQTPRLIYGDTDSIFMLLPGVPLHVAHVLGLKMELVLNIFFAPLLTIKQEFEKIYFPFDLRSKKKRYTGALHEPFAMKLKYVDSKGTEVRRRDNCPALVDTLKRINELLFNERKISKVLPYLNTVFSDIYMGKYDMSKFIKSQKFSKPLTEYGGKSMPHLNVIRKMLKRDAKSAPSVGSRVPYIFTEHLGKSKTGERSEDPHWALKHSLRPDYHYYVQEKFRTPIAGALGRIFSDVQIAQAFSGDFTKHRNIQFKPQDGIFSKIVTARNRCIVCHAEPADDIENFSFNVCGATKCWDGLDEVLNNAKQKSTELHKTDANLRKRCEDCCAPFNTKPESCVNATCDIYFKRTEVRNNANAANTRVTNITSDIGKRTIFEKRKRNREQVSFAAAAATTDNDNDDDDVVYVESIRSSKRRKTKGPGKRKRTHIELDIDDQNDTTETPRSKKAKTNTTRSKV